ncbi:MAG TPA: hypothetical protein VLD57_04025 [Blastocatellia bacterium]|nr:hypothetical protein [Blastocatellia bacterium]
MDFFYEKLIQPGQAGIIRLTIRNTETVGPLDLKYELHTNDPRNPLIKLAVAATVKPLPDFIKRISNADKVHGDRSGAFKIWPTARPTLTFEPGERLGFSLRLRPDESVASPLQLKSTSTEKLTYSLRQEPAAGGYWLDIQAGPFTQSLTEKVVLSALLVDGSASEITVQVTINVPARNLVFTPETVDLGEMSLANVKEGARRGGRLGIRKQAGSFRIKAVTSTLAFLKLEQQVMVDGSNYVIRISLDPAKLPRPGPHAGTIRIETDDSLTPVVEIPVKVKFIQ